MMGITLLAYFLCIQNFIASDTAKLEHNGGMLFTTCLYDQLHPTGTHALHVSRFARIVWLTTQFVSVTAMVIAGAIVKNVTKYLTLAPFTGINKIEIVNCYYFRFTRFHVLSLLVWLLHCYNCISNCVVSTCTRLPTRRSQSF